MIVGEKKNLKKKNEKNFVNNKNDFRLMKINPPFSGGEAAKQNFFQIRKQQKTKKKKPKTKTKKHEIQ